MTAPVATYTDSDHSTWTMLPPVIIIDGVGYPTYTGAVCRGGLARRRGDSLVERCGSLLGWCCKLSELKLVRRTRRETRTIDHSGFVAPMPGSKLVSA